MVYHQQIYLYERNSRIGLENFLLANEIEKNKGIYNKTCLYRILMKDEIYQCQVNASHEKLISIHAYEAYMLVIIAFDHHWPMQVQ